MKNNFFSFLKDKESHQKGIVLLVTFVVMGVIVAIALGVSIILLSELKMIKGMGNSVVAFYAADTGIEKTLYYDRQEIPVGGSRGICNICYSCIMSALSENDCDSCTTAGVASTPETCTDAEVSYTTNLTADKMFEMKVTISPTSGVSYKSYGIYKGVSRAIEISGN